MPRYACPCCRYFTLDEEPPGTFEICPVCWWEDDAVQYRDPEHRGGANAVSLEEARLNLQRIGASDATALDRVRPPRADERVRMDTTPLVLAVGVLSYGRGSVAASLVREYLELSSGERMQHAIAQGEGAGLVQRREDGSLSLSRVGWEAWWERDGARELCEHYPRLCGELLHIMDRHDPLGSRRSAEDLPFDVYEYPIQTLMRDLRSISSHVELRDALHRSVVEFVGGEEAGSPDAYGAAADEMWALWERWRRARS